MTAVTLLFLSITSPTLDVFVQPITEFERRYIAKCSHSQRMRYSSWRYIFESRRPPGHTGSSTCPIITAFDVDNLSLERTRLR
ncbi:uncharacterized protein BDV14DRAFT_170343 [Aspergillus stella-maris]|uniref:uncharacterized protein n=1 Tax=Aspergillus stella-maris TaxID=1810926 RepID=UPI003CCCB4A0